jgi:cyclophilin family peptidyl-prolyl cis-trans isomerase/tetratricopeptide (TPR) repeat protein
VVSFPIAMYGLVQHFGLDPLPWGGDVTTRVASNMGNAIFVAAYLIMILPLTMARLIHNWKETLDDVGTRDGILGVGAFVLLVAALLAGMLLPVAEGRMWLRWVALLVGVSLQIPIYLLSPAARRSKVLTIALPLTFAFLVAFSWILELFFPPAAPNYFWLGLLAAVMFVLAMVAFAYYLRKPVARLLLLSGYFIILIAQFICIFYTQSRGPLLGLLAGVFFFFALLGLIKRRVAIPWAMGGLAIAAIAFLIMFNTVDSPLMERLREMPYVGRFGRVLETEEGSGRVRVLIWEGAVNMIGWHAPLEWPGEDGGPDTYNNLRPIIGHGPESMYVAYNRFYPPDLAHFEKRNASPDRSHNETLDALVTTGWVGLAIYLFLFGSALYFGLKWLGLIQKAWQKWSYIVLWIGGAILGMVGAWAWRGPAYIGVGIPLGALAGVAIYMVAMLVLATRDPDTWLAPANPWHLWVLALLAGIVAHFVEIQFGIAIAATRTYFWVYAAAMVVAGSYLMVQAEEVEEVVAQEPAEEEEAPRPSRRRRRRTAAAPRVRSYTVRERDWQRSLLILSVIGMLIMSTMMFNSITPQPKNPGAVATIWKSLTEAGEQFSPVMLVLVLSTWLMIGMAGLAEMATQESGRDKKMNDWLAAAGVFALVTLGGALIFSLLHVMNLKPVSITNTEYRNPLSHTITFYYFALLVHMLALASVLTFLVRRARRTAVWRWTGKLADIALVCLLLILPVVLAVTIFVSNTSIVRADIVYKEGLSSEKVGQWDAAVYLYEKATEMAENQDFYYLFLGRSYMEKGKSAPAEERDYWMQRSEESLLKARKSAPLNTDHSRNLSKLYLSWGATLQGQASQEMFEKALEYSSDAISLSPNTADVWNERAQIYAAMNDFEQAIETYEKSLSLDHEYATTHQALAQLYITQQEWDKAIAAYQRVTELKPKSAEAYSAMGYAQSRQGNLEAAAESYAKAIELRPRNYLDYKNLAILYNQMGDRDGALQQAQNAYSLAPENEKASLEAFIAQLGAAPPGSTVEDPQQVQELLDAGRGQLEAENWEAAETTYLQVLEMESNNPIAHSALAYIYARQGRVEEAIAENLAVVSLLPNDYNSHKNLAILYRQTGEINKAIEETEQALDLAPEQDKEALNAFMNQLRQIEGQGQAPANNEPASTPQPGQRAGDLPPAQRNALYDEPPPLIIDLQKSYQATIVTEKGNIVVELFDNRVPATVNNFVFLAREGFYDNTTFHRVLPGFMAQAGDPTGTGSGGPGYAFADEFDPTLRHDSPGVLSMANAGANTNGSQFFITYEATPWLDDRHSVFGQVIEGMEVLESLTPRDPQQNPSFAGDKILTIVIEEQ